MHKKISHFLFGLLFFVFFVANGEKSFARTNITDWYIKDFESVIKVNKDSTLDITENIVADCGNLPGKHGIFRILPTNIKVNGQQIKTPVELISITNENNQSLNYQTSSTSDTITWKIGDAKKTVQGVNTYKIHYTVKNVIRFNNSNFDELYWNLNGNFWELETDKFQASIIFPETITNNNTTVDYYTGAVGSKNKDLAKFSWTNANTLKFISTRTLKPKEGITASITFPKNIIAPYKFTFWEIYGQYFFFLIPTIVLALCFLLWWMFGKDPRFNKTVIAEYEVPDSLSPIELGMLMKSGGFENSFITAEIVNFATKGLLTINELNHKVLFIDIKDYEFKRSRNYEIESTLNGAQQKILDAVFREGDVIQLSSLRNSFYKEISEIKNAANEILKNKNLIKTVGLNIGTGMKIFAAIFAFLAFPTFPFLFLAISLFLSAIILLLFSFIMPKRTDAGAELNWKAQGFKLFMETVDKDRAKFYEKENIFEKCLPYAIIFGITKIWVNKMQEIYGQDFYAKHAPVWYVGANMATFDADNFNSAINSLASEISANTSAPSGSGGAGSSGGGGGGGGGGGW